MAVANTLKKPEEKKNAQLVKFEVNGSTVELSPQIVRDYLVSGDKERVTMQEIVMFINLCKFNGLNPWLREAYCIKYGSEPATIVPAKDAFTKRAGKNPQYDGYEAGIIVALEDGSIEHRAGCFYLPQETLVGAWAEVYRKDRGHSCRIEVSLDEYIGRKRDGTVNRQWSSKPATMIRKVALVQALREAFPDALSDMYCAEEQGVDEPTYAPPATVESTATDVTPKPGQTPASAPAAASQEDAPDDYSIPDEFFDDKEG